MKLVYLMLSVVLTGCSLLPFLAEEVKEAVEFEEDAVRHELELRQIHYNSDHKNETTKQISIQDDRRPEEAIEQNHYGRTFRA